MMERDMAEIIQFPLQARGATIIQGVATQRPYNQTKYIALIERFLTEDDFDFVMRAIEEPFLYSALEPQLQKIVDCYFSYDR
jgi:hypothetical protein